jgi:hypothetical protein
VSDDARAALERARRRLDALDLYERPVAVDQVRLVSFPPLFRLPLVRRFHAVALPYLILLRRPLEEVSDDLVTHELVHVWQLQHRMAHVLLTYLTSRYADNPYEREARAAVAATRSPR